LSKTNISGQAKGLQPKQKFLFEESFDFSKQIRLETSVFQMIVPETTGIQQSGWNVFVNASIKVFDVNVGEIRCFEFADVEFETIDGIE
jgi:hypothetical protein